MQGLLVAGAGEWLATAVGLVMFRQALGLPWLRLAIILGLVALCTLLSALVFKTSGLKSRYLLLPGEQGGGIEPLGQ